MEFLKLLSASELVAQIINFLLLVFVLKLLLWKPLLQVLDERKKKIASEFKAIDEQKAEIIRLKGDYESRLALIEQEAKKKIDEALTEGKNQATEIKREAYRHAQEIMEQARADIKYELTQVKEELKERIVDLTMQAAAQMIQEKLTEEKDRRMVEDFLSAVDELK